MLAVPTPDLVRDAALAALTAGISVLPPREDGSKCPWSPYVVDNAKTWKPAQQEAAGKEVLGVWYANGRTGMGVVCGVVSGNLECLDFDDRSVFKEYVQASKDLGLTDLLDRIQAGYLEYTPNGVHLFYRCPDPVTRKLANHLRDGKTKAVIETKGEGGFVIVAPSYGKVNSKGAYELKRGGWRSVVTITQEEHDSLLSLSRHFNECHTPEPKSLPWNTKPASTDRPGDEFNERASFSTVIEPHGWTKARHQGSMVMWRRPDKKHGWSATENYDGCGKLYVFTSSTNLNSGRSYSKFELYAYLNHGGDFKAASIDLRDQGFGTGPEDNVVDLSQFMKGRKHPPVFEPEPEPEPAKVTGFPSDLLNVPGMIGQVAAFINDTSPKPQPVLALGSAISAVATAIGRKVCTDTGLRSNVYSLGVAETGSGKDRCRTAVHEIFDAAGCGDNIQMASVTSDQSFAVELNRCPSLMIYWDEMGKILRSLQGRNAQSYQAGVITAMLEIYGSSASIWSSKLHANSENNYKTVQPNLSIYGTTTPSTLYASMTSVSIADGLLSRFILFETNDPDPIYRKAPIKDPPEALVERFRAWNAIPYSTGLAGNLPLAEQKPEPMIVMATERAESVWNDLESDMRKERERLRRRGEDPGLYARVMTHAQKLSLIRACGITHDNPEISESDAVWGAQLARYNLSKLVVGVERHVSDNEIEERVKKTIEIVRSAGKDGILRSKLTVKTRWMTGQQREDVIRTMIDAGDVTAVQDGEGKGQPGRPKIVYIHKRYDKDA